MCVKHASVALLGLFNENKNGEMRKLFLMKIDITKRWPQSCSLENSPETHSDNKTIKGKRLSSKNNKAVFMNDNSSRRLYAILCNYIIFGSNI